VRCLGDCRCPTRPRCWTVGRNEIADAVGDVAGSCPPLLFSCVGAAGAATGAGAPTVVAVRRPWQPWRRWSWCRLPGCSVSGSPTCSGAARRPGEVSAPGLAALLGRSRLAAPPWLGSGGPPGGCFPALPLNSPALRAGASRQQHWQQPSAASPKRKAPWKPWQTGCRHCPCRRSLVLLVAVAASDRAYRDGRQHRTASAACPVGGRLRAKSIFRVPNHTSTGRN
jgi:hypothetical protein